MHWTRNKDEVLVLMKNRTFCAGICAVGLGTYGKPWKVVAKDLQGNRIVVGVASTINQAKKLAESHAIQAKE